MTLPEAMSITSTSQNKEAAWKYIEFMSSRETEKAKAIALGALPIWTDLLADKELLAAYPYWENFGSQIDKATGLPSVLWYDEFVEILTVESQRIMLGEISVKTDLPPCRHSAKPWKQNTVSKKLRWGGEVLPPQ